MNDSTQVLKFQSTLLIRGATCRPDHDYLHHLISIHAPHTRSDGLSPCVVPLRLREHFNPRSSYEERRESSGRLHGLSYFNPRSSYEERRCLPGHRGKPPEYFNPRSSYEERPDLTRQRNPRQCDFNPRSSYEERPPPPPDRPSTRNFNPRSSYEERLCRQS